MPFAPPVVFATGFAVNPIHCGATPTVLPPLDDELLEPLLDDELLDPLLLLELPLLLEPLLPLLLEPLLPLDELPEEEPLPDEDEELLPEEELLLDEALPPEELAAELDEVGKPV